MTVEQDNQQYFNHLNSVIYTLDDRYFRNMAKTFTWIYSPNPLLGNMIPLTLIENGRTEKLLRFICSQLDDNNIEDY